MATPQDWYLQPQDGTLSKVMCRHCESEIGEVMTAGETNRGRNTDRTEEAITLDAQQIAREHLEHCEVREPVGPADLENDAPRRPPENAPMKNRRW